MFPYFSLFGQSLYAIINFMGGVSGLVFMVVSLTLEWKRRPKPTSPAPRVYNPFFYLKKETRSKYNPIFFFLCYFISYAALMQGIKGAGAIFNIAMVGGNLKVFPGSIAYASGILVFIPLFLLLSSLFPGNGRPLEQLEFVMPAFALVHVFNRMGCFLGSGCCYGIPSKFGIVYPDYARASIHNGPGVPVFPNQLIESSTMLVLFLVLLYLQKKGKRTLPIFPLVFGATGFLLDFGMDHSHEQLFKPMFGFTYPTPFTHLLVFILGLLFLVLVIRDQRKAKRAVAAGSAGGEAFEEEDVAEAECAAEVEATAAEDGPAEAE